MKRLFCLELHLPASFLFFLGVCAAVSGAERTWDGGARDNDWTIAANWAGTAGAPVPWDSLRFPAGALHLSNSNDYPAGTIFSAITYAGAGYTARGNAVALSNGVSVTHASGNTVLYLPFTLRADQTFSVSQTAANLFLNGDINMGIRSLDFSGPGDFIILGDISSARFVRAPVRKLGTGTLLILQHLTYDGPTLVNGGTLRVDYSLSNSLVTVNSGGTLTGLGKVAGIRANSGATVQPGGATPQFLDSLGDVELNAGATLNIRLNGTTAGLNYDQLRVQGTVTLGGTLNLTLGFTPAVGDEFTIIDNDGTDDVVGTFAGMPEGAVFIVNGRPFRISYGGRSGGFGRDVNDVTLEAVPALSVWDRGGGNNRFWTEPLNWVGDILPFPRDDVQFGNTNLSTLITINDFPAGRLFGSIIFAGGDHRLEGNNVAAFAGNIQITQPGDVEILIPMTLAGGVRLTQPGTLTLGGPVTLTANQFFRFEHSDAVLVGRSTTIDLAGHDLTLHTELQHSLEAHFAGSGDLIKAGGGHLRIEEGTLSGPGSVIVNEGSLTLYSFDSVMNATRPIFVNPGAEFRTAAFVNITNLEVRGGTFVPDWDTGVGTVRLLEGSVFQVRIEPNDILVNGASATDINGHDPVELAGCTLDVVISSEAQFRPGAAAAIIATAPGTCCVAVTGTFDNLPEGSRFLVNGHALTINYHEGYAVTLTVGAPFVWDGNGSGNLWTTASNWVADFAPISGSVLVFPAGVSKLAALHDFAPGTAFRSLTFGGASYVLAGNPFSLAEGIYNDFATGETVIYPDVAIVGESTDLFATNVFNFDVRNSSELHLEGNVTGGAKWRKTGTGTLRLGGNGANTHGRVELWQGEVELAKPPGVNAISDSSSVYIGDGTSAAGVTLLDDNQISDSAWILINAPARLDLNGNNEALSSLHGDGTVSFDSRSGLLRPGRLTLRDGNFTGSIVGNGGITKLGPAGLALSGANTFSGTTILADGELRVDGVQSNSPIRLDGGSLTGRGSVGAITANLGGTVEPGLRSTVAFQNMLRSRDVALNAATTFRTWLTSSDPGFQNTRLQVAGTVDLGGSLLDMKFRFAPSPSDSFTIIENDGADPVIGTFAGLPEGAVFAKSNIRWQITYAGGSGNDVVLTVLEVDFRPIFTSFSVTLGNLPGQRVVRFSASAVPATLYEIHASADLVNWTTSVSQNSGSDGIITVTATVTQSSPPRFFRLKLH